nr:DUF58 domain-containing protein [Propionibacterium sp.]
MPRTGPGLTGRGWAVLAVGITLGAGGWFLREPVLLWPGFFLVLLPAASLIAVLLGHPGLAVTRTLRPPEIEAGEPVEVEVSLRQRRPTIATALLVEERPPRPLGGGRFFALAPPGLGRATAQTYALCPARRGRYRLDGLTYRYTDPLGLAVLASRPRAATDLVVLPRILALRGAEPAASGRTGETPIPHLALSGPDDVLVREYRPRDDVRRIHWPSTARTGTLMVRREEQAWDPIAWVLLDTRATPFADDGGDDRFEWLVTLAASVGATLLDAGYQVSLCEAHGATFAFHSQERGAPVRAWQRHLVDVHRNGERSLAGAVRVIGQGPADHLVVALLGRLTPDEARDLTRLRAGDRCWAFHVPAGEPATAGEEVAGDLLAEHGWRLAPMPVGIDPEAAWRSLAAPARRWPG